MKLRLRRVTLHPRYNPGNLDFDVAMLELARPLVFSKYIQPICLPLAIQKFPVGRKCMISGWGNTREGNGKCPTQPARWGFTMQGQPWGRDGPPSLSPRQPPAEETQGSTPGSLRTSLRTLSAPGAGLSSSEALASLLSRSHQA